MPKTRNTQKQRRQELFNRLSPENLMRTNGPIFGIFFAKTADLKPTAEQMGMMVEAYARYFNSWIDYDARKFILQDKIK